MTVYAKSISKHFCKDLRVIFIDLKFTYFDPLVPIPMPYHNHWNTNCLRLSFKKASIGNSLFIFRNIDISLV
jgi:hypothetical protein